MHFLNLSMLCEIDAYQGENWQYLQLLRLLYLMGGYPNFIFRGNFWPLYLIALNFNLGKSCAEKQLDLLI